MIEWSIFDNCKNSYFEDTTVKVQLLIF